MQKPSPRSFKPPSRGRPPLGNHLLTQNHGGTKTCQTQPKPLPLPGQHTKHTRTSQVSLTTPFKLTYFAIGISSNAYANSKRKPGSPKPLKRPTPTTSGHSPSGPEVSETTQPPPSLEVQTNHVQSPTKTNVKPFARNCTNLPQS